jgi:hypothetical protein
MIEIGNLHPLRDLIAELADWESRVRTRPMADADPVAQTLADVRNRLNQAMASAVEIEMELSADQYAKLRGWTRDKLYKRWQRGQLPEASMKGGKLVVPVSALAECDAAA